MKKIINLFILCLIHTTNKAAVATNPYVTTTTFESVQQKAQSGNFKEIFPLIFQNKINTETINQTDSKDSSLLYWSVYHNNLMITNALIAAGGVGILVGQDNDISPLELAIKNRNVPIIKSLIARELIGDRVNLLDLLKTTSASADYDLINTINNSSAAIKELIEDVKSIFDCDQPENEDLLEYITKTPSDNPEAPVYCFVINSKIEALTSFLNVISTEGTATTMQVKIFLKNAPQNYYIELYNAESAFIGVTSINETNTEEMINFYTSNNELAATLSFKNLDDMVNAIKKDAPFKTLIAYEAAHLCSLTTEDEYPVTINTETPPFNNLILYTLKDAVIIKSYLNAILINVEKLSTSNISISSSTQAKESFNDFIKKHFNTKTINITVDNNKETLTTLEPNNTYAEPYYFSLNKELYTIKTKDNASITLLGSTTPFDQVTIFSDDGLLSIATYKAGMPVTVDNIDYENILVTNKTTTTLKEFLEKEDFNGTSFIAAAPPIFSLKTNKNLPIITGKSTTPFNEIKYFKVNENPTIDAYLNGKVVTIELDDLLEIVVINQRNGTTKNISEYIDEGVFTDPCFIGVKPALFEIFSMQKNILKIIGMDEDFNQIKINYVKNNQTIELTTSYYLNENPVEVNNPITKNILIVDAKKNKQFFNVFLEELKRLIEQNNIDITNANASKIIDRLLQDKGFFSPYTIESNPEIFSIKSQNNTKLRSLSSSIMFDEIKYVISNGEGAVYPYLNNNSIAVKNFNSSDITVVNSENNTTQSLDAFIQSNNYTGKYYITVGSYLFDIKKEGPVSLKILGTSKFFDEIKGFVVNGVKTPYTYKDGSPITIENFDPDNVTVKNNTNGTSETLREFIEKNNFNGSFTIRETPPAFDIKTEKNIPLILLGSETKFDQIKYFKLNQIFGVHTYLDGKELEVDNFDPENIIVVDSQGNSQTLTSFIEKGNFKGSFTIKAADPLFDIKTEKGNFIKLQNSSEKIDQIKYFKLNGELKLVGYIHGANKTIHIDPTTIFVNEVDTSNIETLADFIAQGNFKKKIKLVTSKK